jgi:hypothetical protein
VVGTGVGGLFVVGNGVGDGTTIVITLILFISSTVCSTYVDIGSDINVETLGVGLPSPGSIISTSKIKFGKYKPTIFTITIVLFSPFKPTIFAATFTTGGSTSLKIELIQKPSDVTLNISVRSSPKLP